MLSSRASSRNAGYWRDDMSQTRRASAAGLTHRWSKSDSNSQSHVPLACGHTRALPLGVGLGGNPNYLISLAARTLPLRDIMRMSEDDAMRASSPFASLATTASRSARTEGS